MLSNVNALTLMPMDERLSYAMQMLLLGMGTVFAVLIILWLCVALFRLIFSGAARNKADKSPKEIKQERVAEPTPVVAPTAPDNGELLAVITAAVAAMLEAEGSPAYDGGFRVVSFRRTSGRNAKH